MSTHSEWRVGNNRYRRNFVIVANEKFLDGKDELYPKYFMDCAIKSGILIEKDGRMVVDIDKIDGMLDARPYDSRGTRLQDRIMYLSNYPESRESIHALAMFTNEDLTWAINYIPIEGIISTDNKSKYSPQESMMIALQLCANRQYEAAIIQIDGALGIDPNSHDIWAVKGICYYSWRLFRSSLVCLDKAIGIDPTNAMSRSCKANCLYELGCLEEAASELQKAFDYGIQDELSLLLKGRIQDEMGMTQRALLTYQSFIEKASSGVASSIEIAKKRLDILGHLNSSKLQKSSREFISLFKMVGGWNSDSFDYLEKAISLDPLNSEAWHMKGSYLFAYEFGSSGATQQKVERSQNSGGGSNSVNQKEHVIHCFERSLVLDPKNSQALAAKAFAEDIMGWNSSAIFSYRRYLEISTDEKNKIQARQRIREIASRQ